jgi:hypothetical protein
MRLATVIGIVLLSVSTGSVGDQIDEINARIRARNAELIKGPPQELPSTDFSSSRTTTTTRSSKAELCDSLLDNAEKQPDTLGGAVVRRGYMRDYTRSCVPGGAAAAASEDQSQRMNQMKQQLDRMELRQKTGY